MAKDIAAECEMDITTKSSIALSILVMNVARIAAHSLHQFLTVLFSRYNQQNFLLIYEQNFHSQISVA